MTAREEIEVVAAECGWTLAVPLQMHAVYTRDDLILVVALADAEDPQWVRLSCGTRRWQVETPQAVLESTLAWLRYPYTAVHGGALPCPEIEDIATSPEAMAAQAVRDIVQLVGDALGSAMGMAPFRPDRLAQRVLAEADRLDGIEATALVGPGAVAARLRAIVDGEASCPTR